MQGLSWREVPAVTDIDTGHGRRVHRTIKAVQAPDWIDFPGAAQILQLRRTRTIKGRKKTEVVYVICSLDMIAAPPVTVATWIRGQVRLAVEHLGPDRASLTAGSAGLLAA